MDEISDTDLFINFTFEVSLIRVIANYLVASEFSISSSVERVEGTTDADFDYALTKWRYWFENAVNKCVAFDTNNDNALSILLDEDSAKRVGNVLMLTPDDPSDEVLGALFQSKMNALGGGKVICVAMEIQSSNMQGLSFTLVGDHAPYLPATTEAWLGGPSFYTTPWWTRDDGSCIDVLVTEDVDTSVRPPWAPSLDFLDRTRTQRDRTPVALPGRQSFSPTIISGGKDDDDE